MNVLQPKEDLTRDVTNLILGGLLFFTPWMFGFTGERLESFSAWAGGITVTALALAAINMVNAWEEWLVGGAGLWIVVSPWVLGFSKAGPAFWVHVVIGGAVVAVTAFELWLQHPPWHKAG